jgi:hypothetical protein
VVSGKVQVVRLRRIKRVGRIRTMSCSQTFSGRLQAGIGDLAMHCVVYVLQMKKQLPYVVPARVCHNGGFFERHGRGKSNE